MSGVQSAPPPPTTKVGITAHGGFQAEMHYFLVGLDISAKARMFEQQVRYALSVNNFSLLDFQLLGTSSPNPQTQTSATVTLRILAQSKTAADLAPGKFMRPIFDLVMSAYPGGTFHLDTRLGFPRPVWEYFVTKVEQTDVRHRVHMEDGAVVEVLPPTVTKVFSKQQPSTPSSRAVAEGEFGETVRAPLGLVVHARSGDKGSDANVGFFVTNEEQFEWLRRLLSVDRVKELLASEYNGKEIVSMPLCFCIRPIEGL
jgi:hypothetical protein